MPRRTIPIRQVRDRILGRQIDTHAAPLVSRRVRPAPAATVGQTGELKSISDDQPLIELLKAAKPDYRPFRHGKYTHVSDVIHKCVRQIALTRRLGVRPGTTKLYDGHGLTYAQGEAIHDYIRGRILRGYPEKVWARWRCPCGETTIGPTIFTRISDRDACPTCGKEPREYVEVAFEDDEHEVVGSPDLLLYHDDIAAYYLTEIKSIAKDAWEALQRPIPDHVIQGLFYWFLMQRRGYSMVDQFSILYAKKEFSFKLPYKEFVVRPLEQEDHLRPFLNDLEQLVTAKNPAAPLPPRIVCGSPSSPEAKQCSVCVTCFQLE